MNESDVRLHRKLMTKYGIRGRLFSASGDCLGCGAKGYDTRKHDTEGYEEYGPCVVGCAVRWRCHRCHTVFWAVESDAVVSELEDRTA